MKCVAALLVFTAISTFPEIASAATASQTSLSASAASAPFGTAITLTATVTPGSPTGVVTFYDGSNFLGSKVVSGNTAAFQTSLLNTGRHSVTAHYGGDTNFSPSVSAAVPLIVTDTGTGGFGSSSVATDGMVVSVAYGDFNGDGKADLVSANQDTNHISVFLGNGDGTFQAGVLYSTGTSPTSVAVADVNADGKLDVVVANESDNTVGVLLGNGDGTFQTMTTVAVGAGPNNLKVGDFNNDGYPDIAVSDGTAGNISILLNNHVGGFAAAVAYTVGGTPTALVLGDFNADGRTDIAVANAASGSGRVSVLLGTGNGVFSAAAPYAVGSGPSDVTTGDFNNDGVLDLAVANATSNNISILIGVGDGTFATAVNYNAALGPVGLVSTDVNGDLKPDLAIVNSGSGSLSVLVNNGDGTFAAAVNFPTGATPRALAVTNLNSDARVDFAVASAGADDVTIMLGEQTSVTTLSAGPNPAAVGQSVTLTASVSPSTATGSINFMDGATLLATVPIASGTATYTTSSLALGPHTLTAVYSGDTILASSTSAPIVEQIELVSSLTLSVSPVPSTLGGTVVFTATVSPSLATGKVTFYDGTLVLGTAVVTGGTATFHTSLLTGGSHTLVAHYDGDASYLPVLSNTVTETVEVNAGGGFQAPTSYSTGTGPISGVVGDFNNDGFVDLAVTDYVTNNVNVLLGNGDGTFQTALSYPVGPSPIAIATGDFNGDGRPDLVVVNYSNATLSVLLGNGDGTFQAAATYTAGSLPQGITVGDFNGDGYPDLAVTDSGTSQVGILLGVGDGTFKPSIAVAVAGGVKGIITADFNGDLKADLAVAAGDGVYVLIGNGDGTFAAAVKYVAGSGPVAVAATDLGNGKVDLIVVNSLSNSVSVLLGNGDGTFGAAANFATGTFPQGIGLGDFNGDGKTDVVVANQASNDVSLLYSNGDGTLQTAISYPVTTGSGPTAVLVGAFHGTGQADLAVPNYQSNNISVLLALQGSHVTLTASPNPDPTGAVVTLTATILPSNATGSVTFYSATDVVGNAPVVGGVATTTAMLPAGNLSLTAVYSGDTVYGSSVSPVLMETVGQTATIISVTASPNPATFGAPVTFTALANEATANGLVTFYSGVTILGQAALVNGTATLTVPAVPAGAQTVVAQFNGNSQFASARSNPLPFTVATQPGYGLTAPQSYSAGTGPVSVATADFNLDGKMDLVTAASEGALVALGNGNGTFQANLTLLAGTGPTQVITGDFNSDGRPDLAVADAGGNNISVLLGNGDGTFQTAASYGAGSGPTSLAMADFNGDGVPDLVVANRGGNANVLLGKGDGTFNGGSNITVGTSNVAIATGDFNGDGKADLAIADSSANAVWILLGNGDGTFQTPVSNPVGMAPLSLAVGDLNRDGKTDVVAANSGSSNVSVLVGKGDGTFAAGVVYNSGAGTQYVTVSDFNGDGIPDLIVANQAATVGVMIGVGDGTFLAPTTFPTGLNPVSIAVGNFNGDGRAQVAVASQASNSVSILLDGPAALTVLQGNPQSAAAGSTFGTPFQVKATGYAGASGGVSVVFTAPTTGATGIFNNSGSTATVVTGSDGTATAPSFTANGTAGAYTVTATAGGSAVAFTLTNTASGCIYTVTSTPLTYDSTGGTATFTITAVGSSCVWGAASSASWATLSTASGSGNGSVVVTVAANTTGVQRTASLLIAGQTISVTEAGTAQVFADVPPSAYYFDAVNTLYSKGVTAGCSSQPFDYCPTESILRSQMAVFLVRSVYGSDNFTYSQTPYFTDVPSTAFGFAWIQKLYELGITTGCAPGLFCPNDSVTRDQMAVFLERTRLGATTPFDYPQAPYFTDVPPTEFAFAWIQRLKQDQITSGCTPTTYCPSNQVTRGDMAILLVRAAYNLELPAGYPVISQIAPTTVTHGTAVSMTVTGVNTHFAQGLTAFTNLTGITFGIPTVTSPTSLTVQVTVDPTAALQPYSPIAVTGQEEAVLPNGLIVQ